MKNKKVLSIFVKVLIILVFCLFIFILLRNINPRQVDDFSPQIYCEQEIIAKSDVLMVIPIFKNISIAENKSWCEQTLALNKTLGMHGVYHTFNEFYTSRDDNYINNGKEEFKKCFGFYPKLFEAPQVALSIENAKVLKSLNFTILGYKYNLFHKVYHCSDTGKYSNRFIDRV